MALHDSKKRLSNGNSDLFVYLLSFDKLITKGLEQRQYFLQFQLALILAEILRQVLCKVVNLGDTVVKLFRLLNSSLETRQKGGKNTN